MLDRAGRAVAEAQKLGRQRVGKQVVPPHRVADLDRTGSQLVDLRRLGWEAVPALSGEISKGDQPLQVLVRNGAMYPGLFSRISRRVRCPSAPRARTISHAILSKHT